MGDPALQHVTVGLVTIATGRYIEFIPPLVASARKFLLGLGPVFVLTDAREVQAEGEIIVLPWERMEWPLPTLLRYRAFTQYADQLSRVDVLLYTDADMLFVGSVDVRTTSGLIAVQHPGYVSAPRHKLPYERRSKSSARIGPSEGGTYFCGGVQGGRSHDYLQAAAEIDRRIASDEAHGVTAVWHDESHWNRFLVDQPAATQLSSDYCKPDTAATASSRILALTKNHAHYRELDFRAQILQMARLKKEQLARVLRSIASCRCVQP